MSYGVANFALVVIVTNALGAGGAGEFLLAIAVFNIGVKVAELGASTGFIRTISRDLALDRARHLPAVTVVGLAPVAVVGVGVAVAVAVAAPRLAVLFGETATSDVATHLRTLAPFLPVVALYSVVVQGTRGFGTMRPQAFVEKIGKAAAQPVAALVVLAAGAGPRGLALAWVLPAVVAGVPAAVWFRWLARRAMDGAPPVEVAVGRVGREFWGFAAPRALSQVFQVTVLWFDTLLIGALLGAEEAGIYAAATRFLLVGTFTAEAIMQVVGPQISGLVARGERGRAQQVFQVATGWQVLLVWPAFLGIGLLGPALLQLFGDEFTVAGTTLAILAGSMLVSSVFGPSDTVVLMSGRSSLSLVNTVVSLVLNVGGNLVLTPRYGLEGAAVAWALSIVALGALPAAQARRWLQLHPFGGVSAVAAAVAVVAVGIPCLVVRAAIGPSLTGLVVAVAVTAPAFAAVSWALRDRIGLVELGRALRPGSRTRPVAGA